MVMIVGGLCFFFSGSCGGSFLCLLLLVVGLVVYK